MRQSHIIKGHKTLPLSIYRTFTGSNQFFLFSFIIASSSKLQYFHVIYVIKKTVYTRYLQEKDTVKTCTILYTIFTCSSNHHCKTVIFTTYLRVEVTCKFIVNFILQILIMQIAFYKRGKLHLQGVNLDLQLHDREF